MPLRWGKVTMSARADPGLSPQNLQKVKALQDQGVHGLFVKFEHLMTPHYLSETGLGGSPLSQLGKRFLFEVEPLSLLCLIF